MQVDAQQLETLIREGAEALRQGRAAEARSRFEAATAIGPVYAQIWLALAAACRAESDPAGEEHALDRVLLLEPRGVQGLIQKGDCRAKAGDDRSAVSFYRTALHVAASEPPPAPLIPELQRADQAVQQLESLYSARLETTLTAQGFPEGQRSPRFQSSLDIIAGRKRIFIQEPTVYYFPELPQIQFYDPARFAWASAIEAATDAIRAEIQEVMAAGAKGFRPYILAEVNRPRIDENELLESSDWSALFLIENGKPVGEVLGRCPRTWQAVQAAPLPRINGSAPTVMFSLLRAGARITPHTGVQNTRLICHLPLIVPPGCGFRVGNEVRQWEEGKLLVFDDTIEHEAWNESDRDRIVLIFDIWRPELSEQERREVTALIGAPSGTG